MSEWKKKLKRLFVLAMTVVLVGTSVDLSGLTVAAENAPEQTVSGSDAESVPAVNETNSANNTGWSDAVAETWMPEEGFPESEELFSAYVDQLFYGGISFFGLSARDRLPSDSAKALYDDIKDDILSVAAGELESTIFVLNDGNGIEFTYTDTTSDVALAKFKEEFSMVLDAILHDYPYELYWFDKTDGAVYWRSSSVNGTTVTYKMTKLMFYVAGNYQPADYDVDSPTVDTTITSAASTAVTAAKAIVETHKDKTDYEKLVAYKETICDLVSYNHDAADFGDFSENDDPWQLIYVFDGDTSTNVVCEGYSKAYKYLCDMSAFTDSNISCHTVSGLMGSGGHMWNIVTMDDGKNYMVDVTNSDSGTVGSGGGLFLSGATSGSIADGYKFLGINYTYYDDMKVLWGDGTDSILNLSSTDYEPPQPYMPTALRVGDVVVISGGVLQSTTSGTGWSYDASTNTLTLSGGTITGTDYGIYVDGDLDIQVTGDTSVVSTHGYGICSIESIANETSTLKITIDDDAELEVMGVTADSYEGDNYNGIFCLGDLEISGGKLVATGFVGISAYGNLNISDTTIYATGFNKGIVSDGRFTVAGSIINAIARDENCTGIGGYPVATDSILMDNNSDMTVVGDATLKESITLAEDGSLTLEDGATLTIPDGVTLDITKIDSVSLGTGTSVTVQDGGTLLCGHANMDMTNYSCPVCGFSAVAHVDSPNRYYESFEDAIDNADAGATVTLLRTANVADVSFESYNLVIENDIVLNLNENKLELGDNRLLIEDQVTVTIMDGVIDSTNTPFAIVNGHELVLSNVDVSCTGAYGVRNTGVMTVIGGAIKGNLVAIGHSEGELNISGSPQLTGQTASIEIANNPSYELPKIIINEALDENMEYTLVCVPNDYAVHDLISGASGVTLKEEWFCYSDSLYTVVLDSTANTISLLFNLENGSNLQLDKESFVYNGSVQTPAITVLRKNNTVTLTEGTDYTVKYRYGSEDGDIVSSPTNAGFYLAEVTGMGDYVGTIKHGFTIDKAVIDTIDEFTLTAPMAGVQPQKEISLNQALGYHTGKGTVTWSVGNDDFTEDTFDYNTVYTANVVITADGNHQFTENTTCEGYVVKEISANADGNVTITLTKTYPVTEKIPVGLAVITDGQFNDYYATAEAAIANLPATIGYHNFPLGVSGEFDITWSLVGTFDPAFDAENTYKFVIDDPDVANFSFGNFTGSTVVYQNASGQTVNNTASNKEITYDGTTFDVSSLFTIDANAGEASYTLVASNSADAGVGTLNGTKLTITKAGKFTIQLSTATNGAYLPSEVTAVLTVNKAEGIGTVSVEDITYNEAPLDVIINSTTNPTYSVMYTGVDYNSDVEPVEAGDYTITVTFAETDLYKEAIVTDTFTIKKVIPVLTGVKAVNTLYESTLVSEVELTADNMYPGTLVLDGVTELTVGTKEYTYKFTPDDTKNYECVTGKVSLTVLENALVSIVTSVNPNKINYTYGEEFDLTGAIVIATYADGSHKDVTNFVTYDKALVAGQTEVVLTYQGKSCVVSGITVDKVRLDISNVLWGTDIYSYDGKEKSVELTGEIPEGVVVTLSGNKATDAGFHNAKAEFSLEEGYSADNYELWPVSYMEIGWVIEPKEINENNIVYVLGDTLTYNGTEQTQILQSVKVDGLDVTYELIGNTETNAGSYTMSVNGNGNFTGGVIIPWSIAPKNISDVVVALAGELTYDGTEQTQNVRGVTVDGILLHEYDYTISDNKATNAGEYLLTITANANGNFTGNATANWSIAKKDISAVEITIGSALTYNGAEQTVDYTVGKADGLDITYDATGIKATNAGNYELSIVANGNFTGTLTKNWTILPKDITNAQVALGTALTYNGAEQSQGIASVTVDGLTLKTTDYDISGNTATDAGDYTLTITGKGNFSGNVTKAYSVAKASAPVIADITKSYTYSAGSNGAMVSVDLTALLPADFAATSYALAANDANYVVEEAVSADGKLTYKVANTGNIGDTTTLTVTAESKNYANTTINVIIKLTDKLITVLKNGSEVSVIGGNTLTYGQKVGDMSFDTTKAVFVAEGTDTVVEGTLSWVSPDTVNNAGQATAQWKFTPNDTANYTEVTGSLNLTVNKAVPTVALPAVEVFTYHPEKTLSDIMLVGNNGYHTVAGTRVDVDGNWKFKNENLVPVVNNEGYVVVFTPVDTTNYEIVEKIVAVQVTKATPSIDVKPEAATIIYGQTLADAALANGKAAYEAGSTIEVAGSFAWKDTTVAPTVFNSNFTEYEVVFTPEDTDNYNTAYCKLTLTINKAPKAPNMPEETMNVAHGIDKVSKATLPENWSWVSEDADKELNVGEAETAVARYVGSDAGNYVVETVTVTITRASAPKQPAVVNAPDGVPFIYGNKSLFGWDVINKIFADAKAGETIHVDMNGSKTVPSYVEETIQGKDITGTFYMNPIYSWTINGQSITSVSDENLGISNMITSIPAATLNKVCGGREYTLVTLDHNGAFGLTAILNAYVGEKHAGKYANLFYYNPAYGSLQFVRADEIGTNGMAHLPYTSASEYVIVINDTMMSNTYISPKTGDVDMTMYYLYFMALAALAVGSGYVVTKKKRR